MTLHVQKGISNPTFYVTVPASLTARQFRSHIRDEDDGGDPSHVESRVEDLLVYFFQEDCRWRSSWVLA